MALNHFEYVERPPCRLSSRAGLVKGNQWEWKLSARNPDGMDSSDASINI
jgi:hypothetical protein